MKQCSCCRAHIPGNTARQLAAPTGCSAHSEVLQAGNGELVCRSLSRFGLRMLAAKLKRQTAVGESGIGCMVAHTHSNMTWCTARTKGLHLIPTLCCPLTRQHALLVGGDQVALASLTKVASGQVQSRQVSRAGLGLQQVGQQC